MCPGHIREIRLAFKRKTTTKTFGAHLARLVRSRFSTAADTSGQGAALPRKPREELDVQTFQEAGVAHSIFAVARDLPKRKLCLQSQCPSLPVCCEAESKRSGQVFQSFSCFFSFWKRIRNKPNKTCCRARAGFPSQDGTKCKENKFTEMCFYLNRPN